MLPSALLSLVLLGASFVRGQVRNVTIDDGTGDENTGMIPVYGGTPPWRARKSGDSCSQCFLQPAGDKMLGGTWHDATTGANEDRAEISFSFNGTNLYVFCTLAGLQPGTSTQTHLTLVVDGESADTFDWVPDASSPDFQYQHPVLAATSLENRDHVVKVLNHRAVVNGSTVGSLILFDYAVYTTDVNDATSETASPHHSSDSKLALPLGIVCGITGLVLLVGSVVFFLRFRRHRQQAQLQKMHSDLTPTFSLLPPPSTGPPTTVVRSVPGSEVSGLSLNLGAPVVASMSERKLNMRAGLEKHTPSDGDDVAPPRYS